MSSATSTAAQFLAYIHISVFFYRNIYGWLPPVSSSTRIAEMADYGYLAFFCVTPLSWILCFRGECVVSYIYKQMIDPTYQLGAAPNTAADFEDVITPWLRMLSSSGDFILSYEGFMILNHCLYMVSLFLVNERRHRPIHPWTMAVTAVFYSKYLVSRSASPVNDNDDASTIVLITESAMTNDTATEATVTADRIGFVGFLSLCLIDLLISMGIKYWNWISHANSCSFNKRSIYPRSFEHKRPDE
jgi:hypothetical protein